MITQAERFKRNKTKRIVIGTGTKIHRIILSVPDRLLKTKCGIYYAVEWSEPQIGLEWPLCRKCFPFAKGD